MAPRDYLLFLKMKRTTKEQRLENIEEIKRKSPFEGVERVIKKGIPKIFRTLELFWYYFEKYGINLDEWTHTIANKRKLHDLCDHTSC